MCKSQGPLKVGRTQRHKQGIKHSHRWLTLTTLDSPHRSGIDPNGLRNLALGEPP